MKNTIEKNLEKARQRNEKCASCGQKITNCRIMFSKKGKKEGPYCSKKCSETSSLKKETQNLSNSQQVDNNSTSKLVSVIKGIAFFGLGVLPLTTTVIIIYLLNKKKK